MYVTLIENKKIEISPRISAIAKHYIITLYLWHDIQLVHPQFYLIVKIIKFYPQNLVILKAKNRWGALPANYHTDKLAASYAK